MSIDSITDKVLSSIARSIEKINLDDIDECLYLKVQKVSFSSISTEVIDDCEDNEPVKYRFRLVIKDKLTLYEG